MNHPLSAPQTSERVRALASSTMQELAAEWAGQAYPLTATAPAADLVRDLW